VLQKGYGKVLIRIETTSVVVFKVDTFYPILIPGGVAKTEAGRGFEKSWVLPTRSNRSSEPYP